MGTGLDVRLLGPFEVRRDDRDLDLGSPKQRDVLAVLALHAGEVVSRARLIEAVWGADAPEGAAHALQTYVSGLRGVLGADRIRTHPHGYALELAPGELDVDRLGSEVERATNDPASAAAAARAVLDLVRGEPLADVIHRLQAPAIVDELEERVTVAREGLARACLREGQAAEAERLLAPVLAAHPFRETTAAAYLRALAALGRPAEALAAYERVRTALRDELGTSPGPELQAVHGELLAGAAAQELRNPFKGLHAFDEDDAADYFGREALVREVLDVLDRQGLVTVVGPSGIGKSSLLRAGVVPALRSGSLPGSATWPVRVHRSGRDLVAGLEPSGGDELIVVDHLEELFTQGLSEDEVRRGVRTVLTLASEPACRVLLALRADQYHEPIRRPELAATFLAGLVNVLPLRPDELEAAVTGPCANVGVTVEPALLAELAADLAQHPDALPHLQHTLTELFDAREGGSLRLRDYRGLGGLRGTLERRAETVHDRLDRDQRATLQRVLLALVVVTGQGVERRTVAVADLAGAGDPAHVDLVLERLARWRLVVRDRHPGTDRPTVALTHDALLRSWPRLDRWIEAARPDLRRRGVVEAAAEAWDEAGRPDALLLGADALAAHEAWAADAAVTLGRREREFLETARERVDEASRDVARTTRQRHRRQVVAVAVGVALVIVLVGLVVSSLTSAPPRVVAVLEDDFSVFTETMRQGAERAERTGEVEIDVLVPLFGQEVRQELVEELCASPTDGVVFGGSNFFAQAEQLLACDGPPVVVIDGDRASLDGLPWTEHVGTVTFQVEQAAYLAGIAAAEQTRTGVVGVVAGMPILPVERFVAGFAAGATDHDPSVEVLVIHVTTGFDVGAAFSTPGNGRVAAERLVDRGADVILAAAGLTGDGVFALVAERASDDAPLWVIGADTDWQGSEPGRGSRWVLGSVVKRLDEAMVASVAHLTTDQDEPLDLWLGLEDGSVAFLDDLDRAAASTEARAAATAAIVDGRIVPPFARYPSAERLPPLIP